MQLMSAQSASAMGFCSGYPGRHLSGGCSVRPSGVFRGYGRVDGFLSPRGNGFFSRSACGEAMTSRSSEPEQPASGEPDCVRRTTHRLSDATDNALLTTSEETTDLESDGAEIGVTSATMLRSSCSGMASDDPITYTSPQRNRRSLWMVAVEVSAWT